MEPQLQSAVKEQRPGSAEVVLRTPQPAPPHERDFDWVFVGPHGLRVGWSLLLFAGLYYLFREVVGTLFFAAGLIHDTPADSAGAVLIAELVPFLSLVAAALVMILIEDRRILSYNLAGPRRVRHFFFGLAAGFVALSLLVGGLAWGGWLHLAPSALPATAAIRLGALWIAAFLIVASVEEGLFRCYALSTLTRGINFWWALAAQIGLCCYLAFDTGRNGAFGVYLAAAIGFIPLPHTPPKVRGAERILAGCMGDVHVLRLLSHSQRRRDLDRRLRRRRHRLHLLRKCLRHRLRLVGHRLPRGMGLG